MLFRLLRETDAMKTIILLVLVASAVAVPAQRDLTGIKPRDIKSSEVQKIMEKNKQTRIVGGEIATPHSFPFMAVVGLTTTTGTAQCGGTILSSEWILTAAHCLDSTDYPADVTVGQYLEYEDENSQVTITSFDLFQHPGWNKTLYENDIGLIKLVKKIEFNAFVQPVRLASRSQASETYVGLQATVTGWGRTSDNDNMLSDEQRYVNVPVISKANCSAQFTDVNITDSHICTSGAGGKNPCNGDSGGPLLIKEADGKYTEIGIVSFGNGECAVGRPAVYTKVSSYLDWIAETSGVSV